MRELLPSLKLIRGSVLRTLLLGFFFFVFHQVMLWVMTRALLGKPMSLDLARVALEGGLNAIVGVALFLFLDRLRERA